MKHTCLRCGHKWIGRRKEKPLMCPKCKTPLWDRPLKRAKKEFVQALNNQIIKLHKHIIEESGGEFGIRDSGGIFHSSHKIANYIGRNGKNPKKIAAHIYEELARRHHFNDGNKRIAHCFAKMILITFNLHLKINYPNAVDFIVKIAEYESTVTFDEIKEWIDDNAVPIAKENIQTYLKELYYDIIDGRE